MIGREIRVGTGSFDLFLDRECHESMARKYHQRHRERQRQFHRNREVQNRFQSLQPVKAAELPAKFDPMSFTGSGFGFADAEQNIYSPPVSPMQTPSSPVYTPTFGDNEEGDNLISQMWGGQSATMPSSKVVKLYDPDDPTNGVDDDEPYDPASPNYSPLLERPQLDFGFGFDE